MFLHRIGVERLERRSRVLVQELAPLDQDRVVGDLLRQRVLENVFGIAHRRLLVDELAQLQVIEKTVEFVVGLERHAAHQREWKFASEDGKRLQQFLGIGSNTVDARRENPLHRRRNF